LEQRFGRSAFFRDLESLEYGTDFPAEVEKALAVCRVVLVVIGPGWLNAQANGRRRLDQGHDFVRIEVAAALARPDVRTIPVLVGDAQVPLEDELPDVLKPLASRNGIEVSDSRWDYDVNKLGDALVRAGLTDRVASPTAATTDKSVGSFGKRALLGLAACGVLGIVAVAARVGDARGTDEDRRKEISPSDQNAKAALPGLGTVERSKESSPGDQNAKAAVPTHDMVEHRRESSPAVVAPGTVERSKENLPTDHNAKAAVAESDTVDHAGLTWTVNSSKLRAGWNEAVSFCNKRGSGWRLPTIAELRSIEDKDGPWQIQVLSPFSGLRSALMWSADTDGEAYRFAYDFEKLKQVSLAIDWKGGAEALCVSKD
jgi:hypothetical protein